MAVTVSDILRDADAFRRAYPHWPHPEPPADVMDPITDEAVDAVLDELDRTEG